MSQIQGTTTQTPTLLGGLAPLVDPLAQGAFAAYTQPFPGYKSSQVVAPFNGTQNQAFNMVGNVANNPGYGAGLTAAQGLTLGAAKPTGAFNGAISGLSNPVGYQSIQAPSWSRAAASAYEDPYTQAVTKNALAELAQQQGTQMAQRRAQDAGAHAFGSGADQGQSLLANEQNLAYGTLASQLLDKGYTNAQSQFNADTTRGLQAATSNQGAGLAAQGLTGQNLARVLSGSTQQQAIGLAGSAQYAQQVQQLMNMGLTQAQALMAIGDQQQKQQQTANSFDYQQGLAQNQYPWTQTQNLANIIYSAPKGQTTTTPSPSLLSQIGGAGLAGLGLVSQAPGIIKGGTSIWNWLGGGSKDAGSATTPLTTSLGSGTTPLLDFTPVDTSGGFSDIPDFGGSYFNYADGGRVKGQLLYSDGGYASGGRVAGAFADGGEVPDASAGDSSSGGWADALKSVAGGTADALSNPLVLLGASLMSGRSPFALSNVGDALTQTALMGPKLKEAAQDLRLKTAQADTAELGTKQKNILLNFAQSANGGSTEVPGGMLLDPVKLKRESDMLAFLGDPKGAEDRRQWAEMAIKGNFDPSTGKYFVPTPNLVAGAQTANAGKGVAPGLGSTPTVEVAPGAPAALAAVPGATAAAEANGRLSADLTKIGAEGAQARTTQASKNEVVPPNATVIAGGVGGGEAGGPAAPAPLIGNGSSFSPRPRMPGPIAPPANGAAPAPAAPRAGNLPAGADYGLYDNDGNLTGYRMKNGAKVDLPPAPSLSALAAPRAAPQPQVQATPLQPRLVTPPANYNEKNQDALAKEMADTQSAVGPASQALKQIQDIGKEDVNSGPGTLSMADAATVLNKFGVDINKILPSGWQNDPNKVGIVETNLQELAMSLAKASQSGARFTNADLLAAMQSKPNLMLSPGARAAVLNNLEQRERLALDKAEHFRDYAKAHGGQLDWGVLDSWKSKVMSNPNYPDDLKQTYQGLNESKTAATPAASGIPPNTKSVLHDKAGNVLGYALTNGQRVKPDGSPF